MNRLRVCGFVLGLSLGAAHAAEPTPIALWPDAATAPETVRLTDQGEHIVANVTRPSITPYLPDAASSNGLAVVVIPGGGHRELWMDHEGYRVGQWLAAHGVAAFVLKYRLSRQEGSPYTMRDELSDVQRAIRLVRGRAGEWHVARERVGVIGFSAGGELAALAGAASDAGKAGRTAELEDARPAFMGLLYPAIPKDLRIGKETPPTFLLCGSEDSPEISEGTAKLYLALKQAGASPELHIIAGAGHGFGMRETNPPGVKIWPDLFYDWLTGLRFAPAPK